MIMEPYNKTKTKTKTLHQTEEIEHSTTVKIKDL